MAIGYFHCITPQVVFQSMNLPPRRLLAILVVLNAMFATFALQCDDEAVSTYCLLKSNNTQAKLTWVKNLKGHQFYIQPNEINLFHFVYMIGGQSVIGRAMYRRAEELFPPDHCGCSHKRVEALLDPTDHDYDMMLKYCLNSIVAWTRYNSCNANAISRCWKSHDITNHEKGGEIVLTVLIVTVSIVIVFAIVIVLSVVKRSH